MTEEMIGGRYFRLHLQSLLSLHRSRFTLSHVSSTQLATPDPSKLKFNKFRSQNVASFYFISTSPSVRVPLQIMLELYQFYFYISDFGCIRLFG